MSMLLQPFEHGFCSLLRVMAYFPEVTAGRFECWYVLGSDDGASITTTEVEEFSEPEAYFPEVPAGEYELWHGLGWDDGASITTTEVVEFSEPETIPGLVESSMDEVEGEEGSDGDGVVEVVNLVSESQEELDIEMLGIEQEAERMFREDVRGSQLRVDERFALREARLRRVRESIANETAEERNLRRRRFFEAVHGYPKP